MKPVQYAVAQKALSNKYTPIIVGVLVVGGALASYFFIIKPILEGLGIKDTKFDKKLGQLDGFNPDFYKKNISKVTISTAQANKIAQDVYDSWGFASANLCLTCVYGDDNEEKLHGAIQSAGSNYNLSKVSETFQKKFNQNMASFIINFADNSDTERIYKIIKDYKG